MQYVWAQCLEHFTLFRATDATSEGGVSTNSTKCSEDPATERRYLFWNVP